MSLAFPSASTPVLAAFLEPTKTPFPLAQPNINKLFQEASFNFNQDRIEHSSGLATALRNSGAGANLDLKNTLQLDGVDGYASTTAPTIDDTLVVEAKRLTLSDTTPVDLETIAGQWDSGGEWSWILSFDNAPVSGALEFRASPDGITSGSNLIFHSGPLPDYTGEKFDIRFSYTQSTGAIKMEHKLSSASSYTVAKDETTTAVTFYDSSAPLTIGAAASGGTTYYTGNIGEVDIYNGTQLVRAFNAADAVGNLYGSDSDSFFGGVEVLTSSAKIINTSDWPKQGTGSASTADGITTLTDTDTDAFQTRFTYTASETSKYKFTITLSAGTATETALRISGLRWEIDWSDNSIAFTNGTEAVYTWTDNEDGTFTFVGESTVELTGSTFDVYVAGFSNSEVGTVFVHGEVSIEAAWTLSGGSEIINDPASLLDLDTIVGTAANLRYLPSGAMVVGGTDSRAECASPSTPTGSLVLYASGALLDLTTTIAQVLISKYEFTTNRRSFYFGIDSGDTGNLICSLSQTGMYSAPSTNASTDPLTDRFSSGDEFWAFAVINLDTQRVGFLTSDASMHTTPEDAFSTASFLGVVQSISATSIFNSNEQIIVGAMNDGSDALASGYIAQAGIVQGTDFTGTTYRHFDARDGDNANGEDGDTFYTEFGDNLYTEEDALNGFNDIGTWRGARASGGDTPVPVAVADPESPNGFSILLDNTNDDNPGGGAGMVNQTALGLTDGETYVYRMLIKRNGGGNPVGLYSTDSDSNQGGSAKTLLGTFTSTSGEYETFEIKVTYDSSQPYLYFFESGGSNYINCNIAQLQFFNEVEWTLNGGANIQNTGRAVVKSFGGAGLETSLGELITTTYVTFCIFQFSELTGSIQTLLSGRSDGSNDPFFGINAAGNFIFDAGSALDLGSADTDIHMVTIRHNGDSTTSCRIDNGSWVTGDAGSEGWDFATVFANTSGSATANASLTALMNFQRAMTDAEVDYMGLRLMRTFGVPVV